MPAPEPRSGRTGEVVGAMTLLLAITAGCGDGSISGSTETELRPASGQCMATFTMTAGRGVQSLGFEIDAFELRSALSSDGTNVSCQRLLPSGHASVARSLVQSCDRPAPRPDCGDFLILTVVQDGLDTIDAPVDLIRCLFGAGDRPLTLDDFALRHLNSGGADLRPPPEQPVVTVTDIECFDPAATTSTTSTTTVPDCAALACAADEACADGLCVPTSLFEIEVSMTSDILLNSLGFRIHYARETGRFLGDSADVQCVRNAAINGFVSIVHHADPRDSIGPRLNMGIASTAGFAGPLWLLRCVFDAADEVPGAETFEIEVIDAARGVPPVPQPPPELAITRVRPIVLP